MSRHGFKRAPNCCLSSLLQHTHSGVCLHRQQMLYEPAKPTSKAYLSLRLFCFNSIRAVKASLPHLNCSPSKTLSCSTCLCLACKPVSSVSLYDRALSKLSTAACTASASLQPDYLSVADPHLLPYRQQARLTLAAHKACHRPLVVVVFAAQVWHRLAQTHRQVLP